MKKISLFFVFIFILGQSCVIAQNSPDSTLIEKYLLDFAVPDMPAFKALGTDPSNILRPSDAKKFAAMISPFYSNGKGIIPKNFALEFSPWKLASTKWTLDAYNTNFWKRFAYRSSFSIGTINDSSQFSSKLSFGYRVSFLSKKADIYRSAEVRNRVYSMMETIPEYKNLIDYWVINIVTPAVPIGERAIYYKSHEADFKIFLGNVRNYINDHTENTTLKPVFDAYVSAVKGLIPEATEKEIDAGIETVGKTIDDFIEKYKKDHWNASRTDIAMAFVAQSKDSALSNSQYGLFSLWATQALAVHKDGQLLLGLNVTLPRSENKDSIKLNYNFNARYYLGSQDVRGFAEIQYKYNKYESSEKSLLFNLGAEFKIGGSFWVVASAGVNNYLKETNPFSKLVSSLDLRYNFNKPR